MQVRPAPDNTGKANRPGARVANSIISITPHHGNAHTELERARQINRIDALKVLIRSLLDQVDCLTDRHESPESADVSLQAMVRRFETELIRHALIRTGGKQRQAARLLGEKKTTLNAKIIRYGIRIDDDNLPGQAAGSSQGYSHGQVPPSFRNQIVRKEPSRVVVSNRAGSGPLPDHEIT